MYAFAFLTFAVNSDFIYTTRRAIQDLFKLAIHTTGNEKEKLITTRILKYTRKGFFPSSMLKGSVHYEKPLYKYSKTQRARGTFW